MTHSESFHIGYNIISTLICILVLIGQIFAASCHWQRYPWNRDTSLVLFLIFTIFTTNLCCCLCGLLLTFAIPNCDICNSVSIMIQLFYSTSKLSTYLFYLQRAKLAQISSNTPKIPFYCFTRVFPSIYIVIYIIFMSIFIFKGDAQDTSQCVDANIKIPFMNSHIDKWCKLDTKSSQLYINSGIIIEISVTLFFTYLFSSPLFDLLRPINTNKNKNHNNTETDDKHSKLLDSISDNDNNNAYFWTKDLRKKSNLLNSAKYEILNSDKSKKINENTDDQKEFTMIIAKDKGIDILNENKELNEQQKEIKRILIYNIILSLISFTFSSLLMLIWPMNPEFFWWLPWSDYMINSVTTFLMLGRNRKFLTKYIFCCCGSCCNNGSFCCHCYLIDTNGFKIGTPKINKYKSNKNKNKFTPKIGKKYKRNIIYYHSSDDEDFSSTRNYYHNIVISQTTNEHTHSLNIENST